MTTGKLLAALVAVAALPAVANAAPDFATPAEAFKAGVGVCQRSFDGLKARKPFGSELSATPGFAPASDAADQPGVRSVSIGLTHTVIAKAALPEGEAAVYVVTGAGRGDLPSCKVVAVRAPGAEAAAKAVFEDSASGWVLKAPEERDADLGMLSRVYGRPFSGAVGIGATLSYVDGEPKGAITALSSFSLARDQ